jgi:hypothetical protein
MSARVINFLMYFSRSKTGRFKFKEKEEKEGKGVVGRGSRGGCGFHGY